MSARVSIAALDGVLAEHFELAGNAVVPAATDGENKVAVEHSFTSLGMFLSISLKLPVPFMVRRALS